MVEHRVVSVRHRDERRVVAVVAQFGDALCRPSRRGEGVGVTVDRADSYTAPDSTPVVVLPPRRQCEYCDDPRVSTEMRCDPAAHRMTDERDGHPGVFRGDLVESSARIRHGAFLTAVPAVDPVPDLSNVDGATEAGSDRPRERVHPQRCALRWTERTVAVVGAAGEDEHVESRGHRLQHAARGTSD